MRKLFVFSFLLFSTSIFYGQEYCKVSIKLKVDVIDRFIDFHLGEFNKKLDNDYTIKGNLETCKGHMNIEVYNEDFIMICKGGYMESLDTLKDYTQTYYVDEDRMVMEVFEYFHPLKDGTWFFYDEKGKMLRTEEYERGIKISESKK